MNKFITLEAQKKRIGVGIIYAKDLADAYEQVVADNQLLIVPETQANQLIVDVNKMLRRKS